MTNVTIVSTFTAIPTEGKIELGNLDVGKVTISDLKQRIEGETNIPPNDQRLWWRGYVLDHEDSSVMNSCVGVNEGELLHPGSANLVLFLTMPYH
ncbi:hypothetical protein ACA910_014608 [Epithemia clementina (nom. ined.)]